MINIMFQECNSLISLPDISKWDTSKVTNMRGMYSGCYSLTSLPDISKWDISNVNNMGGLLEECNKLKYYLIYQYGILLMLLI